MYTRCYQFNNDDIKHNFGEKWKICVHGGKMIKYRTNQQKIDPMKLPYKQF